MTENDIQSLFKSIEKGDLTEVISSLSKCDNINALREDTTQKTLLAWAIFSKKPKIVKALIYYKIDVNEYSGIATPLRMAVEAESEEMVRDLLAAGANVNEQLGWHSLTLLETAAQKNNFAIIKMLIDHGVKIILTPSLSKSIIDVNNMVALNYLHQNGLNINEKFDGNRTLLWIAVAYNNTAMVKWLLNNGAKFSIPSAFTVAVEKGNMEIVQLLLNKGGNVNFQYTKADNLLVKAIHGQNPFYIVKELMAHKANPNLASQGTLPLVEAVKRSRLDIIETLLKEGGNPNLESSKGVLPLIQAIEQNQDNIVACLLEGGANPNLKNAQGVLPLVNAVELKQAEIVKLLLEKGANPNVENPKGDSPLMQAIKDKQEKIVALLLEKGANPKLKDKNSTVPLMKSIELEQIEISKNLVNHGADVNLADAEGNLPLMEALKTQQFELVLHMLDKGAKVNIVDKNGISPLLRTLRLNQSDVGLSLLGKGADPNFADKDGNVPLITAVNKNQDQIVTKLLASEADTNVTDKEGKGPLTLAIELRRKDVTKVLILGGVTKPFDHETLLFKCIEQKNEDGVKFLVNKKPKMDAFSDSGFTPLTKSVQMEHCEIAKILIKNGAKIDQVDGNQKTALKLALRKNNMEIVNLLVSSGCDLELHKEELDKAAEKDDDFRFYLEAEREKRKKISSE